MNRILLDLSAFVAFMEGRPEVVAVVREAGEIYLSSVTVGPLLSHLLWKVCELAPSTLRE